jgi:hypothetical protein
MTITSIVMLCRSWPALLFLTLSAGARAAAQDYDLRGQLPPGSRVFGDPDQQLVRVEPEGLRMTLPKDRKKLGQVGLSLPVALPGDFQITASFEILEAEAPAGGFGVGAFLALNQTARILRVARAEGEQVIAWNLFVRGDGQRRMEEDAQPCEAKTGRLRLQRVGPALRFLWSPASAGDDFEEIHQCDFPENIKEVRLLVATGKHPARLDVRFADLRVQGAGGDTAAPSAPRRRLWLAAASVTLLLLLFGLGAWLYTRRSRRFETNLPNE